MEQTVGEIKHLRGCINDLISILALPAIWSGHRSSQIMSTLLDVLIGMLRLDFAYVQLSDANHGSPIEVVRLAQRRNLTAQPQEVGRALNRWLAGNKPTSPCRVPNPLGEGEVSIAPLRLGLHHEVGVLVAGSRRPDFPTKTEMLLLQVAANQAAIGLQEARLLTEQRRAAEEIERRVVDRTRQLTAVNERLRQEIIQHRRSQQCLATQYAITRVLAESASLAEAIPHLLQAIGESMAWEWGALWTIDSDAGVLRCDSIWHVPNLEAAAFDAISRETASIRDSSLKGRVWQSAEPAWIADVTKDANFIRAPIAAKVGLRGAIAFPILLRGETVGIMEFFSRMDRQPEEEDFETLSAIGSQIGQFVERKRVEEEHRKLASLVENSHDFIGIAAPEGHVLFVNPSGQQMVGIEGNEQVRATMMFDYVLEQERERVQQQVLPVLMRDGHWEGETQFRHFQTGVGIPMQHHVFLIKEPSSDRPVALATISHDISERKRAEEKLGESERRFRLLAEAIPHHVWNYLPDGSLGYYNQQLADYTGLSTTDLQQGGWAALHPGDREHVQAAWQEGWSQGTPYEVEQRVRGRDGRYRRFLSRAVPVRDERGQLVEWFGTNTDIEERRQAEEALHKAQADLAHATRAMTMGELTASIAHEVNQPLTAVINNSNACLRWLTRETADLEALREALRDIITNGQRASDIITRIRRALKKAPTPAVPLAINEVIEEVVELTHHKVQQHGVQLRIELAADLPPTTGDRVQIQQVFLNLLMNGIEAMITVMDRPRRLLIRSGRAGSDDVLITVQDSGIGLDSQTLERMFDAFYTTKPAGMGMGLSISRTIITAHGG